jgi:hypothetical protein
LRRFALALFAALVIGVVAVGCGGGDSSSSGSTSDTTASSGGSSTESESSGPAPTKAAFIKEADAICGKADAAMTEEITDFAKENGIPFEEEPSEDQQVEIFDAVVLPNIAQQAEEIAALTPPEGEEATVEDITDTLSSEVAEAEEADGIPDESTLEEASKKAKAYGLKTCGS